MPIRNSTETFIIGEVSQNHDGSLGQAHAFIDAIAKTGVHAVKFQTHIAEAESSSLEQFRIPFSYQDTTRFDYWKRMEFTEEQWIGLKNHADKKGLIFLSSPFSISAVELLERIGVPMWKVGSGETSSYSLLEKMAATQKLLLVSTGMSSFSEIDGLVNFLRKLNADFTLMQCTTAYPCPPEKISLNAMLEMHNRYSCPVGFSDHSGTIYPGIIAAYIGASVVEVHVTLTREMFGPDVAASVTTDELKKMVEGIRFADKMKNASIGKDALSAENQHLKKLFGKSAVAVRNLEIGTILSPNMITFKKPGNGLSEAEIETLWGKKLLKSILYNQQLSREDLSK